MAVTLKQARQGMLKVVDPAFAEYSATSGTITTVVLGALVNGATGVSNRLYDSRWLYFSAGTGAGQVRKVDGGGYTPASGTLAFQPPGTAPGLGTTVEMSSLFPPILSSPPEETDSRTVINRAIETILLPRRVTLTATTADSISLTSYVWLDRPERFLMDDGGRIFAWEPALVSGRQPFPASWRGIRFVRQGASNMLTIGAPFAASGSLIVDVLAPGHTFVNGVESVLGLVADTDSIDCDLQDILPAIKREAYAVLVARSRSRSTGEYDTLYADAREEARKAKYHDWTREDLVRAAGPQQQRGAA